MAAPPASGGTLDAESIIRLLSLAPHPEGGHFAEMFRDSGGANGRAHSTAIYFLLRAGEKSQWHRVDAAEVWHWYAGAPLSLVIADNEGVEVCHRLGNNLLQEQRPQIVVPANAWQSAESLGDWTLVGCTVAPGFEFDGFEMAPDDWTPAAESP